MKYVLDSNIGIKWRLPESDSAQAIAVKDDYVNQIHDLHAPDVFPIEVAHAFSRAERMGVLKPPEGTDALNDILQILPQLHESLPLLPRAFEISSNARIGVDDCLYVALAEREGCSLLTADQRLVSALGTAFPFIILLGQFP